MKEFITTLKHDLKNNIKNIESRTMGLEDLGYNSVFEKQRQELDLECYEIGRVVAEHKERYTVRTDKGEFESEITGNMRFTAKGREDFPAVGDWVALKIYDPDFAIIYSILPRFSIIKRLAVGQFGEIQVIAANIDYAFIVQAVDRDFNINRIERYLTICNSSKIKPVIILSKTDLMGVQEVDEIQKKIRERVINTPVISISNESKSGYEEIKDIIKRGKTYCLLGSSGVGKSTLLNNLSGRNIMETNTISTSTNKGKHTTTYRELIVLDSGGIIIDNPGIREVGIADTSTGLEITFDEIVKLAQNCRFKNCTHTYEPDCGVLEAIKNGDLDAASYENYLKIRKERAYFDSSVTEKRKKEKSFGKMIKNFKKHID